MNLEKTRKFFQGRNNRGWKDLAENDVVGGRRADVTVNNLENDTPPENALG